VTATARLTTGWEPELPIDDTLLRSVVFLRADVMARAAAATGGQLGGSDEAAYADTGSPSALENGVVLLQPPTAKRLDVVLRAARRFFPPERPWSVFSVWPTSDLRWRDLQLLGHPPLLVRLHDDGLLPLPDIDVRGATDADTQTLLTVLGVSAPQRSYLLAAHDGTERRRLAADRDAVPVALCATTTLHGIADAGPVWQLPTEDGPTTGAALLAAALDEGPDVPAVALPVQLPGHAVGDWSAHRVAGFRPLLRTTVWVHPGPVVPPPRATDA